MSSADSIRRGFRREWLPKYHRRVCTWRMKSPTFRKATHGARLRSFKWSSMIRIVGTWREYPPHWRIHENQSTCIREDCEPEATWPHSPSLASWASRRRIGVGRIYSARSRLDCDGALAPSTFPTHSPHSANLRPESQIVMRPPPAIALPWTGSQAPPGKDLKTPERGRR